MKNHTTQQRVNLNVTGGGSIARYYISGAFFNENGLFISDPEHEWDSRINYKRYNFTSNVDVNLHPTTILKLNIGGRWRPNISHTTVLARYLTMREYFSERDAFILSRSG